MAKENIVLGLVGVFIGVVMYVKTSFLLPSLVPLLLGLALILFNREEGIIEKRRDKS